MSKEKNLLKTLENLVEEQPNPKREPVSQENHVVAVLSEKRKRALLSYLACLFGAAFIVVSISWVASYRNHELNLSQIKKEAAGAVESLEQKNEALSQRVAELEHSLEYGENAYQEYVETMKIEAAANVQRVQRAYDTLLLAKSAFDEKDYDTFSMTMLNLEPYAEDLGEDGRQLYDMMYSYNWNAD